MFPAELPPLIQPATPPVDLSSPDAILMIALGTLALMIFLGVRANRRRPATFNRG